MANLSYSDTLNIHHNIGHYHVPTSLRIVFAHNLPAFFTPEHPDFSEQNLLISHHLIDVSIFRHQGE